MALSSHPASQTKIGLPPVARVLYWLLPSWREQKSNRLVMKGGGFLGRWWQGATEGEWEHFSSTASSHQQIHLSRQHRPKDLSILQRDIHLIKINYCEDTRPQNQLSAAQEQQKGLCSILQGASVSLHTILWEWVALSTTIIHWSLLRSWVLNIKGLRNSLPSFMFILLITLPNSSMPDVPFPAL